MRRPSRMQLRLAGQPGRASIVSVASAPVGLSGKRPQSVIADGGLDVRPLSDPLNRPSPADKGKQGRNCNVTACQRPGAWFLNSGTRAYYCFDCAWDIRKFNLRPNSDDGFILFEQWDEDLKCHREWVETIKLLPLEMSEEQVRRRLERAMR